MRVDLPPGSLKKRVPAHGANELLARKKVPPSRSAAGFLLMDSSLNPISFNTEAIQILSYPDKLANIVKAFLRLIMIKTGVSSRSAVVGKIILTQR